MRNDAHSAFFAYTQRPVRLGKVPSKYADKTKDMNNRPIIFKMIGRFSVS